MLDFLKIKEGHPSRGVTTIEPSFKVIKSRDLLIRGGKFYAVWCEDKGLWSTDEDDVVRMIDRSLWDYYHEHADRLDENAVIVKEMVDGDTKMIDKFHHYCERQRTDSFVELDGKVIFSNTETSREDYASMRLDYPLAEGECPSWERLMEVLYSPEERHKIEWAIGSIVNGDSKKLQKFLVLYGAAGTGKGTVLKVIHDMFTLNREKKDGEPDIGYCGSFIAKELASSNNQFSLESLKDNPLVAIQYDGDLSSIEDNTRLNSLISHEIMPVNTKNKSIYNARFRCFLFMGTNSPVKITDGRSGMIRRLIDVSPTENTLKPREYDRVMKHINYELGAIAYHCKQVYEENPGYYNHYIPKNMMGASNIVYDFVLDEFYNFLSEDETTLAVVWERFKQFKEGAQYASKKYDKLVFKEDLKTYFREFYDRASDKNGLRVRSLYRGFKTDLFDEEKPEEKSEEESTSWLVFEETDSIFDKTYQDCFAQYATANGTPKKPWAEVSTKLSELDTHQQHFVLPPTNLVCMDFDICDETGQKSLELNIKAASLWPPTYAELSRSGGGIHLYYIYTGDVSELSHVCDTNVEVKTFQGKSALRRLLTKCNKLPIAVISSGLPLKERKMINKDIVMNERNLRTFIIRNMNKEFHADTRSSIDFIYKGLTDIHESGVPYDVSDMQNAVLQFAMGSTHQARYCVNLVSKMPFKSETPSEGVDAKNGELLTFFDIEVYPTYMVICWKFEGDSQPMHVWRNPTPQQIEELSTFALVGFNNKGYDNHICYARMMLGETNYQSYVRSQKIISGDKNAKLREADNFSYTDVFDFSSKKQSLKKFEIELGIDHMEMGIPWDEPVAEDKYDLIDEYCSNDVRATEAVFNARHADYIARLILVDLSGLTANDSTNNHSTRIIFGTNRHPQSQFNYRFMGDVSQVDHYEVGFDEYTAFDINDRPIFPGYSYVNGVSTYRGEEIGEGGYVYAEPGVYYNVTLLDIASMHPSSIIAEQLFGPEYTARFKELCDARLAIKHKDFEKARTLLGGKLAKYLTDDSSAKELSGALKIVINAVYGQTAASYENPFHDIRNKDNIVAKRGALFMVNLKHEVQKRGFTVAHIKTDSIKIPNATPEIIKFVMDYGHMYGYNFEHEATYDRMCLVNDAVYIAKYNDGPHEYELPTGEKLMTEWTATGTQFRVPYVFKTLFSRDPIQFNDMCETKSVTTSLYFDMNEDLPADQHDYRFIGKVSRFCPVVKGAGGGELLRKQKNPDADGNPKFSAVAGGKGYRWLEAGVVKTLGLEDKIDISYYRKFVDDAIADITEVAHESGTCSDFYEFVGEENLPF